MNQIIYHIITNIDEINILLNKDSILNGFSYKYDIDTINLLKKNFILSNSLYIIVKQDETFVAFISTDTDWWEENCYFIREIFVNPEFQGQGIGIKLMKECIEYARKNNANYIITETAFDNLPMQRLCEILGFKKWDNPKWKDGITYKFIIK